MMASPYGFFACSNSSIVGSPFQIIQEMEDLSYTSTEINRLLKA